MYRGAEPNQTVWVVNYAKGGVPEPLVFISYFKSRKTLVYTNKAYCKPFGSQEVKIYSVQDLFKTKTALQSKGIK